MRYKTTAPVIKPESVLCGECDGVVVKTFPNYWENTTVFNSYFCLNCMKIPSTVTYIYK